MIHSDLDDLAGDAAVALRKMVSDNERIELLKELPSLLRALTQLRRLFDNWSGATTAASWWHTMSTAAVEVAEPLGRRDARLARRRMELMEHLRG